MSADQSEIDRLRERLEGDLLAPGDPGWDNARTGFNLALDPRPALIAVPRSDADVAATVEFAAASGLRVAAQGTAHGAGALASLEDSILMRTTAMKGVEIDAERRRAYARAGDTWHDLVPQASELGLAALHGSAPGVGIVGYTIGGGVGWYSRSRGIACNRVTAFDVVDAGGEARRVDAASDSDLFWALRGGGGSFAVVTGVEFELIEVPQVYAGALFFPFERAGEILHAWREWTATVPEEMTSLGRLMQFPPIEDVPEPVRGKSFVILETIYSGDEAAGAELNAPLTALDPVMNSLAAVPPAGISDLHMDPPGPVSGITGHLLLEDLPAAAIDDLLAAAGPGSGSTLTSVEVRHGGGALSRPPADGGALSSLPGSFNMFAVGSTMDPAAVAPTRERLGDLHSALVRYEAGRYLSFCEEPTEFETAFSDETCERLRAARRTYDPDGLFQANHELV
ncbi:MAG TPA: FAD-binding oxidoreductase [Solirubrobacterales bacterium]|nr:FAD-binding oxidoreductase [Solirubrobacterales bacterium]